MGELYLIRHAQASFGAEDYDKLSALGHEQSVALGNALSQYGVMPEAWVMGDMRRHCETLEGIAQGMGVSKLAPLIHSGLNEFDFTGLLNARYRGQAAPDTTTQFVREAPGIEEDKITVSKLKKIKNYIKLQLQIKNCSVSRFILTTSAFYLHGFNETPHITTATQRLLTYS
ncbi:MAG: hypothetical protein EBW38_11850 [Rhodobacteraceae bacterium]|nr:hypothetical protein [Paracoccaceae bacterium]